MLIDEIKKANIQAMKDRDATARAIFSVVITKIKSDSFFCLSVIFNISFTKLLNDIYLQTY